MERATVYRYETEGATWAARREPVRREAAIAFGERVAEGRMRIDVGAGAGRYTGDLGQPIIALDAAATMLDMLRERAPDAFCVRADLEFLPLRSTALHGAWANMSYLHIPRKRLPLALWDLHRSLTVGAPLEIQVLHGTYEGNQLEHDDIGGRFFASWEEGDLSDILIGAGFSVQSTEVDGHVVRANAIRQRSLADTVSEGMRLLVCGLNPSVYAADRGVGFARRGNRFWPAAVASGLVTRESDAVHALTAHCVGMTDLCKRATVASAELAKNEYRGGADRLERIVRWLQPGAVCFVGLEGWRAAIDPRATAGLQPQTFGGRPAYVMPSTSGLNAATRFDDLVDHLRAACEIADTN